jgi:ADP-ribose pyrophosphatase YjhB (NUDIX family)
MTYHEKRCISDLDFDYMWLKLYKMPITRDNQNYYMKKKNKFQHSFLHDRGDFLRQLLSQTPCVDLSWEVPKGRRNLDEPELSAAMREFYEETNLTLCDYDMLDTVYIETYTDLNTVYQNKYWLVSLRSLTALDMIKTSQSSEIADVRFMHGGDLTPCTMNADSHARLKTLLKTVKSKFKNHKYNAVQNAVQNAVHNQPGILG